MLLVDTSRFEKKEVQFTFHYCEVTQSAHGFNFRHVLTKALVKQVGYKKVPPSHSHSFLKAQLGNFQRLPSALTNLFMCSWPNNQGEKW